MISLAQLADESFNLPFSPSGSVVHSITLDENYTMRECHCCEVLNRRPDSIRNTSETELLKEIQKQVTNKNDCLEIICLGTKIDNFEHMIILAKLIKNGYSNIQLHLVDHTLSIKSGSMNSYVSLIMNINYYFDFLNKNSVEVSLDKRLHDKFLKAGKNGKYLFDKREANTKNQNHPIKVTLNLSKEKPLYAQNKTFVIAEDLSLTTHATVEKIRSVASQYISMNETTVISTIILNSGNSSENYLYKLHCVDSKDQKELLIPMKGSILTQYLQKSSINRGGFAAVNDPSLREGKVRLSMK